MEPAWEPLVEALASDEAVAFVGAGASASAGIPTWRHFLQDFIDRAPHLAHGGGTARALLRDGDYLLAAEVLHRKLHRKTFEGYIYSVFGTAKDPTPIHTAISRLPFIAVLTTNFDRLLENAYPRSQKKLTWKDREILDAIRQGSRPIVKIHGTVDSLDTIRLTRTDYRDATHDAPAFNDCLKSLLLWKTFLFVGYSLRDIDLLHLIDEARMRFKDKFGPHYAILPADEVDDEFKDYLKETLAIYVIKYEAKGLDPHAQSEVVARILRDLAGVAAERRSRKERFVDFGDVLFNRYSASQGILDKAVSITGSLRGDVCFQHSEKGELLERVCSTPRTEQHKLPSIKHDQVIGAGYLHREVIYLPDTSSPEAAEQALRDMGLGTIHYVVCDPAVKSEYVNPVISDGARVGALNLEADVLDAYPTDDHKKVIGSVAEQLGWVYYETVQRQKVSNALSRFYEHPGQFEQVMHRSRLIKSLNLTFFLYGIDYIRGRLVGHSVLLIPPDRFDFDFPNLPAPVESRRTPPEPSLAMEVFRTVTPAVIEDIEAELRKPEPRLNRRGVEKFGMRGPLYACPLRAENQTAAVLVTWSRKKPKDVDPDLWETAWERVLRLSNLLANDIPDRFGSAEKLIEELNERLFEVDEGRMWDTPFMLRLRKLEFRQQVLGTLMRALLHPCTGLTRVRVWRRADPAAPGVHATRPLAFYCVGSLTAQGGTRPGAEERDAYTNHVAPANDPFCEYVIKRSVHDRIAKRQHPEVFGSVDSHWDVVERAPGASWIVAPLLVDDNARHKKARRHRDPMVGAIAADSHVWSENGPVATRQDRALQTFQLRAVDLVADVMRFVVPFWRARPNPADLRW